MAKVLKDPAMNRCILCYSCALACARYNYDSLSVTRAALRVRTAGGMQGHFVASICRSCRRPTCAAACPTGALEARPHGGAVFERDKCIGCGRCAPACKAGYLRMDESLAIPLFCRQCGICTTFCPHGCLVMEEVKARG